MNKTCSIMMIIIQLAKCLADLYESKAYIQMMVIFLVYCYFSHAHLTRVRKIVIDYFMCPLRILYLPFVLVKVIGDNSKDSDDENNKSSSIKSANIFLLISKIKKKKKERKRSDTANISRHCSCSLFSSLY